MFKLDPSQEEAVKNITNQKKRINILSGGGGFGKSTIIKMITELEIENGVNPDKIYFIAPTGKSSLVLQDSVEDLHLTNPAMTIHRLFGCRGVEWEYDSFNKIEAELVFVDEASLIDSAMFARILYTISDNAKIIFSGDNGQLHPIGAGCPFADIISANINVNELKKCWRQEQGSLIANASMACRSGNKIIYGQKGAHSMEGEYEDNLFLHQIDGENRVEEIMETVADILMPWFSEKSDYVLLSPQNTGDLGTVAVNKYLQKALNSDAEGIEIGETRFQIGDRVKQTKNDYNLDIYNGSIGTVVDITVNRTLVVDYPTGVVEYPDAKSMFNLILGFCVTIFSSQGSGYDNVAIIMDKMHTFMHNRSLAYVALSRAKRVCHIVGQKQTVARAINKNMEGHRSTYLQNALT